VAANYAFSQIANPIASNVDGSVTYLIGDQTIKVKDEKIKYLGEEDGKYLYRKTLTDTEGKQYYIDLKLDKNFSGAEYVIKSDNQNQSVRNVSFQSMIFNNPFTETNYTSFEINKQARSNEDPWADVRGTSPATFQRAIDNFAKSTGPLEGVVKGAGLVN